MDVLWRGAFSESDGYGKTFNQFVHRYSIFILTASFHPFLLSSPSLSKLFALFLFQFFIDSETPKSLSGAHQSSPQPSNAFTFSMLMEGVPQVQASVAGCLEEVPLASPEKRNKGPNFLQR